MSSISLNNYPAEAGIKLCLTPEVKSRVTGAVCKNIGYPPDNIPEYITLIIDSIFYKLPELLDIRYGCRWISRFSLAKGEVTIDDIVFRVEAIIGKRLQKSTSAILFILTIGPGLENTARKYAEEGDMLKSFITDAVASELVEYCADIMEKDLKELVSLSGMGITNRYSPGYCGWHVSEQQKLFSFFPPGFCGITLTQSSLMVPIKSISGIIGAGPHSVREEYECSMCSIENCYKRNQN